jgi:hypothetical protein
MEETNRLSLVLAKVNRAQSLLGELRSEVSNYEKSHPCQIGARKAEPDGGVEYFLESIQPIPDNIVCITGDIIQNLRHSLDHLVHQLFLANNGDIDDSYRKREFPIVDRNKNYPQFNTKVAGLSDEVKTALGEVEAFEGGKGYKLWQLNTLSNTHKHRTLLTVASNYSSFDIAASAQEHFKNTKFSALLPNVFIKASLASKPIQPGDALLIDRTRNDPISQPFRFIIVLNDPVIDPEPLDKTLEGFAAVVSDTILSFEPYLV